MAHGARDEGNAAWMGKMGAQGTAIREKVERCVPGTWRGMAAPGSSLKERKNYARVRELRKKRRLQASLPYTTPNDRVCFAVPGAPHKAA